MTGEVVEVRAQADGRRLPGPTVAGLVFLGLTGLGVLLGRIALNGGQPTWAVLFGATAAMPVVLVVGYAAAAHRRRGTVRAQQHGEGLEIIGSVWPIRAEALAGLILLIGTAIGVVVLTRNPIDVNAIGPIVLLAGLTVIAFWPVVKYLTGRRSLDSLVLDQEGFTVQTRGRIVQFFWEDAMGFKIGGGGLSVQILGYERTMVSIPMSELRSDPRLVAQILEYYHTHEHERSDLSSGAALDRLRYGALA
ncbi:MAG: hypothetical protein ACRCTR_09405 [Actinomycetota bacterium]